MVMSMREKILNAVAKIIATEGIDAVSIRYVCEKVGVKAPTIYYYFKDKRGVIEAVIGLAYQKYGQTYLELAKHKSPVVALKLSWDLFIEFVDKNPELYHAIVEAHLRQRIPKEGVELFEKIAEIFKKLEEKGKLRLPYSKAAEIFYAAAYGQALVYVSQNKNPNLIDCIRFTRDLCIQGLMTE